jgi:PIN domain nuclease of toxin-antitoxin system
MTKKEQELTNELHKKDLLIEISKELAYLQHERIEDITKLLGVQKTLTDNLQENHKKALSKAMSYSKIQAKLVQKMDKKKKEMGLI